MRKNLLSNLSRFFPVGYNWRKERNRTAAGLVLSLVYCAALFCHRLSSCRRQLYYETQPRILREDAVMPDFSQLYSGCLIGFEILFLAMILAVVAHYRYHYQESKSIYLMKRLPDYRQLHIRCLSGPAFGTLLCILTALMTTLFFYGIYHLTVPPEALSPEQ